MNLEALERFVMDTIDVIFTNPSEYEANAVKSTIAYRFELYRQKLSVRKLKTHHIAREELIIKPPKINHLSRAQIEDFATKED